MSSVAPCASPTDISSLPIIDFALASSPSTKPLFLSQLRHALVHVGFLYLSNHTVSPSTVDSFVSYIPKLFDLPLEEKEKLAMMNSPHFHGYVPLGAELASGTHGKPNFRELFDFANRYETKWKEGSDNEKTKQHWRIMGPAQFPDESLIPGFRQVAEQYFDQVGDLSYTFVSLIAEALGLPPDGFDRFFDRSEALQHRIRVLKYPVITDLDADDLGTVPHCDIGFLTFLLQASPHCVLQVENPLQNAWIEVPPVPGTFVVNIGRALEYVTQGVLRATLHRVISPRPIPGELPTPRYSVPFFQSIGLDVVLGDNVLDIPPEILALKEDRRIPTRVVPMAYEREPAGMVRLIGKMLVYPEVGEKFYPDLLEKYLPLKAAHLRKAH